MKAIEVRIYAMTDCPIARKYVPELRRLAATHAGRVRFVARTVDDGDARRWAREFAIPFPVSRDVGGREARAAGVVAVPCAVVLRNGKAVYRGRIDDRYPALGVSRPVRRRDLAIAIEQTLKGRPVTVPTTRAIGCLLPPE